MSDFEPSPKGLTLPQALRSMASVLPRVSIVINTACADPEVGERKGPEMSLFYKERANLLANVILPRTDGFDEVVVAGIYPCGLVSAFPKARFVTVPSQRRDRWDALLQREVGARYASGEILVFCHDDHAPGEGLADYLRTMPACVDIVVPKRLSFTSKKELNSGREEGYMGGHCYAMRRWIWAAVPLTSAPNEYWDIYLTPKWRQAGASIVWTEKACHYDCETRDGSE